MLDSLFWYKLVFMGELILAEGLFSWKLRHKSKFYLRLAISILLCLSVAVAYPILAYNSIYASFMFAVLFGVTVPALKFCYNEPWKNVLFCAFLSYAVQHLAFLLYNVIVVSLNLVNAGALGTYLEKVESNYNAFTALAYAHCYYLVYWLSYLFCGTKIQKHKDLNVGSTDYF